MSKPSKPITKQELNKLILSASKNKRNREYLGYLNKTNSELYEEYQRKRRQFLDVAKKYKHMNKMAMVSTKVKTEDDYLKLNFDFMENVQDEKSSDVTPRKKGLLLRKRTVRSFNEEMQLELKPCVTEPWFKRHLALGKFIQAARTVILKNRLLKVLDKLNQLDDEKVHEYETLRRLCHNVSYSELFDKFL